MTTGNQPSPAAAPKRLRPGRGPVGAAINWYQSLASDPDKFEHWRFWFNVVAPFYFVAVAFLRSYLETAHFSENYYPSYYRSLDHVLWFATVIMTVSLYGAAVLKLEIKRTFWTFYAITATLIPLFFAYLTNQTMALEYHSGTWQEILKDVLSFSMTASHNHPVAVEGVFAAAGATLIGYYYCRKWVKSILCTLGGVLIVNFFAIAWLGPPGNNPIIQFKIPSDLSLQPFLASYHIILVTFLTGIYVWRGGLFQPNRRAWIVSGAAGLFAWAAFSICAMYFGWFPAFYDALTSGLFFFTCVFLAVRLIFWTLNRPGSSVAMAAFLGVLVLQMMTFFPIYWGVEEKLTRTAPTRWVNVKPPFYRLRLPINPHRPSQPGVNETHNASQNFSAYFENTRPLENSVNP